MSDLRKAAEFALEAMEKYCECGGLEDPIEELRQALAHPEQEPVAYTRNGTAGREADVRPTGFFFQIPNRGEE